MIGAISAGSIGTTPPLPSPSTVDYLVLVVVVAVGVLVAQSDKLAVEVL